METVLKDKSMESVDLVSDFNRLYVTEMEHRFSSSDEKVKLKHSGQEGNEIPIDNGKGHLIAMGLYLGLDNNGKRRTPFEVFQIMYKIFLAENRLTYPDGKQAHEEALKSAWGTGILRQVRGQIKNLTEITNINTKNIAYSAGGRIIETMIKKDLPIGRLIDGKVTPANLRDQEVLGVTNNTDSQMNKIVRSDVMNSLRKSIA